MEIHEFIRKLNVKTLVEIGAHIVAFEFQWTADSRSHAAGCRAHMHAILSFVSRLVNRLPVNRRLPRDWVILVVNCILGH